MPAACTHDDDQPLQLPPLFRSEGFAEDLDEPAPLDAPHRLKLLLGVAAPLGAALVGMALALTGSTDLAADATAASPPAASTAAAVSPAHG